MDKTVLVYADLRGAPLLVGRLWARQRRDRESATFEYEKAGLRMQTVFHWSPPSSSAPVRFMRLPTSPCSGLSAIPPPIAGTACLCAGPNGGVRTGKNKRLAP